MGSDPHQAPSAVAVAASAGGVEALIDLVAGLPPDFSAVVLVVLHIPAAGPSVLPRILDRAGHLPAVHAQSDHPLTPGTILVAPPDHHLFVEDGRAYLSRGPREHGHRPAADVLFRSVARNYLDSSAGVVLSGMMDDGVAGLRAIKAVGGFALVQDPEDAAFPAMPTAALREVAADGVGPAAALGGLLASWAEEGQTVPERTSRGGETDATPPDGRPGSVTEFTCPECGGTLWTRDDFGALRFRCRVGHSYSPRSLFVGKQEALEAAVWAAIVALEERADLARRMLRRVDRSVQPRLTTKYQRDIEETMQRVDLLRELLMLAHEPPLLEEEEVDDAEPAG